MGWRWVKVIRQWTGCLFLALAVILAHGGIAEAASKTGKKTSSIVCKPSAGKAVSGDQSDDNNDDDDDDDKGVRFQLAGACAKLTGGVSYTYQKAQQTASGLPIFVNRNGTVSRGTSSNSMSANIGLETARPTALGEFKTSVGAEWSKATDDDTQNGSASVSGWSVGLGGLTVGYTGSLIGFWEGDFLSSANAPGRSASTIVYEYAVNGDNKVSVGLESNLPTTPQSETGIKNFDFSDPVYTARWRY